MTICPKCGFESGHLGFKCASVLTIVIATGQKKGVSVADIAAEFDIQPTAAANHIAKLRKLGLIQRVNKQDWKNRGPRYKVTSAGMITAEWENAQLIADIDDGE